MNIWTAEAVGNAVLQGNPNLEIVFTNYLKQFIIRLGDHNIILQDIESPDLLYQKVLDGIDRLEEMVKEFLSVIDLFALTNNPLLKQHLPHFFEKLLNYYEENSITLYTGRSADILKNDHYRFFNQSLFIALTALLVENKCFDALQAIIHARFSVYLRSYKIVHKVNFLRFREYNYTLNEYLNNSVPRRISVTADFIYKYSQPAVFEKLIKADILLYYISLWNQSENLLDPYWYPELSVYNRDSEILPFMVSKEYFDKAKVLFGVNTIQEYKALLDNTDDRLQRRGLYRVPELKKGLLYDTVGSSK